MKVILVTLLVYNVLIVRNFSKASRGGNKGKVKRLKQYYSCGPQVIIISCQLGHNTWNEFGVKFPLLGPNKYATFVLISVCSCMVVVIVSVIAYAKKHNFLTWGIS